MSDSRLFYGILGGEEQAGSIKCFVLLAAAAFALAGVRACPQRACHTVRMKRCEPSVDAWGSPCFSGNGRYAGASVI